MSLQSSCGLYKVIAERHMRTQRMLALPTSKNREYISQSYHSVPSPSLGQGLQYSSLISNLMCSHRGPLTTLVSSSQAVPVITHDLYGARDKARASY